MGGHLLTQAGGDIELLATDITVGGDATLVAEGDIEVRSLEETRAAEGRGRRGRWRTTTESFDRTQNLATIAADGNVVLSAGEDLNIVGGSVVAGEDLTLAAAGDTLVQAAQQHLSRSQVDRKKGGFLRRKGSNVFIEETTTNVGGELVAGGDVRINATQTTDGQIGRLASGDVTITGAEVAAGDDLVVLGEAVTIQAQEESLGQLKVRKRSGLLSRSRSKDELEVTTYAGGALNAQGDVTVVADSDATVEAGIVRSTAGDVRIAAGLGGEGDINLISGQDSEYTYHEKQKSKIGPSFSDHSPNFKEKNTQGNSRLHETHVATALTAGNNVSLDATNINIVGSNVTAGHDAHLTAEHNVNVINHTVQQGNSTWQHTETTGISVDADENTLSAFVGKTGIEDKSDTTRTAVAASQINAGNDLTVRAGNDINQIGSDFGAGRDITLVAGNHINSLAAQDITTTVDTHTQTKDGLGVSLNHNTGNTLDAIRGVGEGDNANSKASSVLAAVDAINSHSSGPSAAAHLGKTSTQTTHTQTYQHARGSTFTAGRDVVAVAENDIHLEGTQANTGRDILLVADDVNLTAADNAYDNSYEMDQQSGGIQIRAGQNQVSIGVAYSEAESDLTQHNTQTTGTQLNAANDVSVIADNDIHLIGSHINSGNHTHLSAGHNLNVVAGQNSSQSDLEENSLSGGAGIAITVGEGGASFGVYAEAAISQNDLERDGNTHTNSQINAGNQLNVQTGNDANFTGANVRARHLNLDIGNNLTVASVQDTGTVEGERLDANISVTAGAGFSASGGIGIGETEGDKAWVQNQTTLVLAPKASPSTFKTTRKSTVP